MKRSRHARRVEGINTMLAKMFTYPETMTVREIKPVTGKNYLIWKWAL